MPYSPISGYMESLRDPRGLFRTLGTPVCECDFYGQPKVTVGGNAAVFRISPVNREFTQIHFPKLPAQSAGQHPAHINSKPVADRQAQPHPEPAGLQSAFQEPAGQHHEFTEPHTPPESTGQHHTPHETTEQHRESHEPTEQYALKCFLRPVEYLDEVCRFLQDTVHPLLCRSVYIPQELFVFDPRGEGINGIGSSGNWHDVVIAEWAQGRTLDFEMRKAIHDGNSKRMASLAAIFDRTATELLTVEWAHGDIKPENIIISPSGELKLIDYDSMYIPAMAGHGSNQTGTPLWQHPRRNGHYFNRHIDDYPAAMLSATLHCLAADISLHTKYGKGDIFLFDPAEIMDGRSKSHAFCMDEAARSGNAPLYRLLDMLRSPTPHIEGLSRVIGSFAEDRQWHVCRQNHTGPAEDNAGAQSQRPSTKRRLSLFRENGAWGYMDDYGKVAIQPLYDSGLEFSQDGTASVMLGKYRHLINEAGIIL